MLLRSNYRFNGPVFKNPSLNALLTAQLEIGMRLKSRNEINWKQRARRKNRKSSISLILLYFTAEKMC